MKTKIAFALLLVISFSFTKIKKKDKIPPGTKQITETFFADETEVSNFSWQEYEFWTKTKYGANSKEHLAVLPDTLVWRDSLSYNEPYVVYYYRHPAYKDYPVVGISHEQALAFCKWRTERVKEYYAICYKKDWNIEYRLPTKEEWEFISNNGNNINFTTFKNNKGQLLLNCILPDSAYTHLNVAQTTDVTAPVFSYYPNHFKIYNMFGNVAEMISEKGICKGGSWRHRPEQCRAGKDVPYSKPEAWLGFRCVCVVN